MYKNNIDFENQLNKLQLKDYVVKQIEEQQCISATEFLSISKNKNNVYCRDILI